jgi:hypothetical protein
MSDNATEAVLDNPAADEVAKDVTTSGSDTTTQTTNKNWFDDLEPDLKANPSITKFKNPGDLGKSYIELQKALGKDKVVVPTEKSTPEEWKAFWKKAGAPEKDDEYDVGVEDLPEQARMRQESLDQLRKAAHGAGVTKKQFDAMFGTYKKLTNDNLQQEIEKLGNLKGETETSLRSEWGAAYEPKVAGAQKVIDTFFKGKNIRPEFSILANDKGFIAAMADIAEKIGEDVIAGKARVTMTPSEAQSAANEMLMDRKGPLHNEIHPEHDAAVDKYTDLMRMAQAGQ